MKWYLAGPMSGQPDHGYPAFEEACQNLRRLGYDIVSPHEVDHSEAHEDRGKKDHWDYMRLDLQELVKCDAIILLDNWHISMGACQELNVAIAMGIPIYRYDTTVSAPALFYQIN